MTSIATTNTNYYLSPTSGKHVSCAQLQHGSFVSFTCAEPCRAVQCRTMEQGSGAAWLLDVVVLCFTQSVFFLFFVLSARNTSA